MSAAGGDEVVSEACVAVPTLGQHEERTQVQPRTFGNLKVVIDWSMLGINKAIEPIQERSDALTHAKFIGRLFKELSSEIGDQLRQLPIASTSESPQKGYRLSDNPERDFFNPNANKPFGHKLVPNTKLYLFTNTNNATKVSDIKRLARRLGFPSESIVVS